MKEEGRKASTEVADRVSSEVQRKAANKEISNLLTNYTS